MSFGEGTLFSSATNAQPPFLGVGAPALTHTQKRRCRCLVGRSRSGELAKSLTSDKGRRLGMRLSKNGPVQQNTPRVAWPEKV